MTLSQNSNLVQDATDAERVEHGTTNSVQSVRSDSLSKPFTEMQVDAEQYSAPGSSVKHVKTANFYKNTQKRNPKENAYGETCNRNKQCRVLPSDDFVYL